MSSKDPSVVDGNKAPLQVMLNIIIPVTNGRSGGHESVVTKDFNPELGFVSRNDVIGTTPGIFWYYRGKLLPF